MTYGQFEALYEQTERRKAEEHQFLATLHGYSMDKNARETGQAEKMSLSYDNEFNYNGDPASVAHLTAEQREEMTQKMISTFKKELG